MQKWFSNNPTILVLLFSFSVFSALGQQLSGPLPQNLLLAADSLYHKKKFAEARELYFQLFQNGYSSPATLLKMAFVQEGLGQPAQALFFLSAYYRQTEDAKAFEKIQTLANAHHYIGYDLSDFERATIWLGNRLSLFLPALIAGCLLCIAWAVYCVKKGMASGKTVAGLFSIFFVGLLVLIINVGSSAKAVTAKPTYFMSGPSAGANFLGLLSEGNQVSLSGEEDVWVQVKWNGKEGYIKKNDLLLYNR